MKTTNITRLNIEYPYKHLTVYISAEYVEVDGEKWNKSIQPFEIKCGDFDTALATHQDLHDVCKIIWSDELVKEYQASLLPEEVVEESKIEE